MACPSGQFDYASDKRSKNIPLLRERWTPKGALTR